MCRGEGKAEMSRKSTVLLAALATTLATAIPTAAAAPLQSVDPENAELRNGVTADELEEADVTVVPTEQPSKFGLFALGTGPEPRTYLVRLADAATPSYSGGVENLAATAPEPGEKLDADSPKVEAYRDHLQAAQVEVINGLERAIGRDVEVPFTYQHAVNGFAAVMTPDEAAELLSDPRVVSVTQDFERELHTDRGPQWIGADALWNATTDLGLPEDYKGEGIVIGTIDTGINPANRSFAEVGQDGYVHENPLGDGNFLGACDPDNAEQFDPQFVCNNKLIGAYVFGGANDTAVDYDGHGSHTASTSGGNVVLDATIDAPTTTVGPLEISGVAPHANVISYLGCCTASGLTASIDQAIADGVDVINYSIGSDDPGDPWSDFDTIGFLNARAAGIFVATSNGNEGPGDATTGSPSSAPWITSVGAATHDRLIDNAVIDLTSSAGNLPDISGKSITGALPSAPVVEAADFDVLPGLPPTAGDPAALCGAGTLDNAVNPFAPGTFNGEIVICNRGVFGRVQMAQFVFEAGAGGYILANDEENGDSLSGDAYALPGVHITFDDGVTVKNWLANGATDHTAAIRGTITQIDDSFGDIMAAFSSRGPNRAMDVIVPDVTAPGVDILAAIGAGGAGTPTVYDVDIHGVISGTSMASPHIAGTGALLTQARPDWTPAEMQSALMTTARDILNHDGGPATPYAQGAGMVNVDRAVRAGLLFDESIANYLASEPAEGGDPKTLNLPSFANTECLAECSWDRTANVPASAPAGVTWTASATSDTGLTLDVNLSTATVSPGDTLDISVAADVAGTPVGETLFGEVVLTPDNADVPALTLPVAVEPTSGVLPSEVNIDTRRNAGSFLSEDLTSIEITEFTGTIQGFVPATLNEGTLVQDPTNGDPYDDLSQVDVYNLSVPAGATRLIAEVLAAEMPDADLYIGTGTTPSPGTQVCQSTSGSSAEVCDVSDPAAGDWWVLLQNWGGTDEVTADAYTLATAVVPGDDLGNGDVVGPDGPIAAGEPYDIRTTWDIPEMAAGERWYGTAVLGTSPSTPDDIGSFPVTITRHDDDVTKTASVAEAEAGDTVSYDITVQPNVTPVDQTYTITDTVPDGFTIDESSVTGGGVVDGQTITWEVESPTAFGVTGDYVVSTPATSEQCADWSGFVDLGPLGISLVPQLDGDTVAVNAFSGIGPFEVYNGLSPNLTVSEDGFITVAGGYGGSPWIPQAIPNAALPNGVIAPLWSDLELSVANDIGIRLATAGDVAVIQYDNPFEFRGDGTVGPSVGKFQAWVYNSIQDFRPEITFEYGEIGALPASATIGIEHILASTATAALNVGDPSTVLEPGGTICLDWEGPSFDPVTVSYDVTVDDGVFTGTYTNAAVHTTDDPFAQDETASVDVAVSGIAPCTEVVNGLHFGSLNVNEGVTCLEDALVLGTVTVGSNAAFRSTDSAIAGRIRANGAAEVTVCGTGLIGDAALAGGSAVTFGDPANGCGGNTVLGKVAVTGTDGPSVIGGNHIIGRLSCSGNEPPPVNNGSANSVLGKKTGQCSGL
jgi:uncharacterized repeat protein (TIGR01451 family)